MTADNDSEKASVSTGDPRERMRKYVRKRNNDSPIPSEDAPADGDGGRRQDDHDEDHDEGDDESDAEPLDDLRHFLPEVGPLDLLLRRAPGDVVAEHVREQGLRQMDAETAEEEEAVNAKRSVWHETYRSR